MSASISLFIILIIELFTTINNLNVQLINIRENNNLISINEKISIKIENKSEWKIQIPKINLNANIAEGTTEEILDFFVGHFEETPKYYGNVCLAAHNRGYNVNYFSRIKELEIGDKVIYTYGNSKKEYEVMSKEIIKDTNVEVIENPEGSNNMLTLITCVENMPELRRCIKCAEIKKEN